jgi:hypothetical protein
VTGEENRGQMQYLTYIIVSGDIGGT